MFSQQPQFTVAVPENETKRMDPKLKSWNQAADYQSSAQNRKKFSKNGGGEAIPPTENYHNYRTVKCGRAVYSATPCRQKIKDRGPRQRRLLEYKGDSERPSNLF